MSLTEECVVLMDNGSLRPEATLSLRMIAQRLSDVIGVPVEPVSLLHSSKIPAEKLGGVEAQTWRRFARKRLEAGRRRFRIVPLFFGPSSAIVDYLPKVCAELRERFGDFETAIAPTLLEPGNCDPALAKALSEMVLQKMDTQGWSSETGVILVDHGSPLAAVARCRNEVGSQLAEFLDGLVAGVIPASMERREGDEYAFNEPLLETALESARLKGWKRVVIAYLFFSPGRHAGGGGDIDQIVAASRLIKEGADVVSTPLFGSSPVLPELLAARYRMSLGA